MTPALRFTVLGELAMGGMGRVDLARADGDPPALVAVKRLHGHLARDREFLQMFVDEVWMTGAIAHENVVRLLGWGSDADGLFLATELVAGAPLAVLTEAPAETLPDALVALVGMRVAAGLAAAHALVDPQGAPLGVVHRDVSPANVLVAWDGAIKIADFGIAKAHARGKATATGVLKGKVSYMAPEYVSGGPVDARADLYSLGVVLYELASGARPFAGDHEVSILKRIVDEPAVPLAARAPRVDPELAATIDGLLAKDPASRPATADALARTLEGWLDARGVDREDAARALGAIVRRRGADLERRIERLSRGEGSVPDATAPPSASAVVTVHTDRATLARMLDEDVAPARVTRRVLAERPRAEGAPPATSPPRPASANETKAKKAALVAVACVLVAAFALAARRHASAQGAPSEAAPSAAPSTAAETDPEPAPSGDAVTSSDDAAVVVSAPPPPKRGRPRAAPPRRAAPSARSCTPHDFDYPRCLR